MLYRMLPVDPREDVETVNQAVLGWLRANKVKQILQNGEADNRRKEWEFLWCKQDCTPHNGAHT